MTLGMKQRFGARLLLAVAGVAGAHSSVVAQQVAASPLTMPVHVQRDRAEGLLKLDVLVTDSAGKPAMGLNASDFRLFENGREQKILSFDAFNGRQLGSEPPVKIILLMDTIDLPTQLVRNEQDAVESFLRENDGLLSRPTSVFELTNGGLWTLRRTSIDGRVLANEIEHNQFNMIRYNSSWNPGTGQPAHAMEYALQALGHIATEERRRAGKKLLIWIGPEWGVGTGSVGAREEDSKLFGTICWFSDLLREARVVLYNVAAGQNDPGAALYKAYVGGVTVPKKASLMNLHRMVLAIESGGRVVDDRDLFQEIEESVEDAGAFYRISFDPLRAERVDEYHDLKVEVDDKSLIARTNSGYYDQPFYSADQIPPLKRISLEELQNIVELDESDAEKARQLTGVELAERLSERRLLKLHKIAHGKRTRQQLRILADVSAFLEPPADELLKDAAPDESAQRRMLAMASEYLKTTIHKLPDLFAKRVTVRFQESPQYLTTDAKYQPLHPTDSWTTNIRYRNGAEVTDEKARALKSGDPELITHGEFGPVLQGVLDDINKNGQLTWRRWEQGDAGPLAVFRYVIPGDEAFYLVSVCCTPDGDGTQVYARYPRYHGEISIDPENGAILRLTFQSDLKSTTPLSRSDIAIEYGPVDMGGKTYICPIRSVSILRARSVRALSNWDVWFRIYGPYATMLNDVTFDRYHVFRTNSRILTDFTPTEK